MEGVRGHVMHVKNYFLTRTCQVSCNGHETHAISFICSFFIIVHDPVKYSTDWGSTIALIFEFIETFLLACSNLLCSTFYLRKALSFIFAKPSHSACLTSWFHSHSCVKARISVWTVTLRGLGRVGYRLSIKRMSKYHLWTAPKITYMMLQIKVTAKLQKVLPIKK